MRAPVALIACCVLAGALLTGCGDDAGSEKVPTPAEARAQLRDAPPALAALHAQANELLPGGTDAFDRRLEQLRGHPVVVNVWAEWCRPCKEEFPVLQRAAVKYGRSIAFLGVDTRDVAENARAFLDRRWVAYPSYVDHDGDIADDIGVRVGIPGTVFYDRDGEVAYRSAGPYRKDGDLERDLQRYLGAKPSS